MAILQLVVGLVVLTVGAELLVRGASTLALAGRISPLVVGLTVVAYGTSMPELVVSLQSTLRGQPDIALGNVVGSNIFNVLFILGLSALIIPLRVSRQLIRFDVPLMVGVSLLTIVLAYDGVISRLDGLLLTVGLLIYTIRVIIAGRKEQADVRSDETPVSETTNADKASSPTTARVLQNVAFVAVGLLLLIFGSRWFTDGAIVIAREFGLSELVIGLTIVAAGTSLPEVATSVVAAIRGERDIAVGNVVGSNLFNILGVLGLSGLISAEEIAVAESAIRFDLPVMTAVAVACLPILFTGQLIARWEGAVFLAYFFAYTSYLIADATNPEITRTMNVVMGGFVVPLTVLTLTIGAWRAWRSGNATGPMSTTK